jgi:hypothetical protein
VGKIIMFPGVETEINTCYPKGLLIINTGDPWPDGVEDYRETLEIPGYYLLGWRMVFWGRLGNIPTWETFWLPFDGTREFLRGITRQPKERHETMCEVYPGYTPGSRIGRDRAITRFYQDDTEYGVICRPDLLLEKKDFRPKLREIG